MQREMTEELLEGDEKLFVKFYMGSVRNDFKSEEQGHPVFDAVPFVRIIMPGDKNTVVDTPVRDQHKTRFPRVWEQFQRMEGDVESVSGMPIREWPAVTRGQAEELAYLNVFSVEQLADLTDVHGGKIMNFNDLQRKARAYVQASKDGAFVQKLTDVNAGLQSQIDSMKTQLEEYAQAFAQLQAQQGQPNEQHGLGSNSNRRK